MKLNLGSGKVRIKGFLNVDIKKGKYVDIVQDLNKKRWNFKSNSVDEIFANSVLEHLIDVENFMSECYRILKPKGVLHIIVPHFNNSGAYRVDHLHFFTRHWFKYFLTECNSNSIYGFRKFKIIFNKVYYSFPFNYLPNKISHNLSLIFGNIGKNIETKLIK